MRGGDAGVRSAEANCRPGEAIQQIINIYQTYLAGMSSPGRPIGNFLFLGPTGSGKTRLVEAGREPGRATRAP